jgi:superfamily II DNA or RNA helicase
VGGDRKNRQKAASPKEASGTYFAERYDQLRFPISRSAGVQGLREAQIAATQAIASHFFTRREPAIVVMPTGSGKSVVMILASIALRAKRVLVLTPSRMVREQLAHHFATMHVPKTAGALPPAEPAPLVKALKTRPQTRTEIESLRKYDVIVATVQGLQLFGATEDAFPHDLFDLIIWDEAHHAPAPSWEDLQAKLPLARHVLFTATPFRRDAKTVRGRVVLEYPLARARNDGLFGRLRFEPVEPGLVDPDVAIARATERRFRADADLGLRHLVMVRASLRSRAEALAELYEKRTKLRLRPVFGNHSRSRVLDTLEALERGELDGIICVDMLGEGFDFPRLKIAALHSPHKSLAVTLQFIGRFARTNSADVGDATFLAVPGEISAEAQELYRVGAEWNEIVEEASRTRLDTELAGREVLQTFEPVSTIGAPDRIQEHDVDVGSLWPFFHVKVYEAPHGVDLDRLPAVPSPDGIIFLEKSVEHSALVCVTRTVTSCRWTDDDRLANVSHDLFVAYYDEPTRLLFLCTSQRDVGVYDNLVGSLAIGDTQRLTPEELNRVLRGIEAAQFFSVGMRNRSAFGNGESYRTMSGLSADRAVQKSDGRYYDRGHCYGRGTVSGKPMTIGFSSASKVWSNKTGRLPALIAWCRALAAKLVDTSPVETHSNLDHLPLGTRAKKIHERLISASWPEELFASPAMVLEWITVDGEVIRVPALDTSIEIISSNEDEAQVEVVGDEFNARFGFRVDRPRFFEPLDQAAGAATWADVERQAHGSLVDFLNEFPPALYASDLSRLSGDVVSPAPKDDAPFDVRNIECVDWDEDGIDPLAEKRATRPKKSIFDWLQARLLAGPAAVIFNDDGAGEVADFVAVTEDQSSGQTRVELYHCKAAKSLPVPGDRVQDVYEVAGQAIKCLRVMRLGALRAHLRRRASRTRSGARRLVRGSLDLVDRLLADAMAISFTITIVQPGVGAEPGTAISHLLASANAYLVGGQAGELRVIGGKG